MDELIASYGGIVGGLVLVVLLLVREVLARKNGKNWQACPVVKSGTPMTREQHEEVCIARLEVVDEKLHNVDNKLEFLKGGQAVVKEDIKKILGKLGD